MRPDSVRGEEKIWREWWVELLKGGGWRYGSGRGLTSGADPRVNAEECLLGGRLAGWEDGGPSRCAGYDELPPRSPFESFYQSHFHPLTRKGRALMLLNGPNHVSPLWNISWYLSWSGWLWQSGSLQTTADKNCVNIESCGPFSMQRQFQCPRLSILPVLSNSWIRWW